MLLVGLPVRTQGQDLISGDWRGGMVSPDGAFFDMTYHVSEEDGRAVGSLEFVLGAFALEGLRADSGVVSFNWRLQAGLGIACRARRLRPGVYVGGCLDDMGGIGAILMAHPEAVADPSDMTPAIAYEVWGRSLEEERAALDGARWNSNERFGALIDADVAEEERMSVPSGWIVNLLRAGEGDGTVVFESGLGDDLRVWRAVLGEVSGFAQVVAYDRAGLGQSEPDQERLDLRSMVDRMREMLAAVDLHPPYLLVGEGFGSLLVRLFAASFPDEVSGLVLVHPVHEETGRHLEALDAEAWLAYWTQQRGFYQALGPPASEEFDLLASVVESGRLDESGFPGGIPVIVLTADCPVAEPKWLGQTPEGRTVIRELHAALAKHYPGGEHRITNEACSLIPLEHPELVVQAVRDALAARRSK